MAQSVSKRALEGLETQDLIMTDSEDDIDTVVGDEEFPQYVELLNSQYELLAKALENANDQRPGDANVPESQDNVTESNRSQGPSSSIDDSNDSLRSTQITPKKAKNSKTRTKRPFAFLKTTLYILGALIAGYIVAISRIYFWSSLDASEIAVARAVHSLQARVDAVELGHVLLAAHAAQASAEAAEEAQFTRQKLELLESRILQLTKAVKEVPVVRKNGLLLVAPDFEEYVLKLLRLANQLEIMAPALKKYLPEMLNDELVVVSLENTTFFQRISEKMTRIRENERHRDVLDAKTLEIVSEMVRDAVGTAKQAQRYNYADYENGARIDSAYVSAFTLFNVSELYKQQQKHLSSWKYKLGLHKKDPVKYTGSKLVQNTYQAILNHGQLPRDNFPNTEGLRTGIKTFAVKLARPIFLSDIVISYPRFVDSASYMYSAPKKIGIWVRLEREADLEKVRTYLKRVTQESYAGRYVVNLEQLEGEHNEIPMKRIKKPEEEEYEKFYESNFGLFKDRYVKIGLMEYDVELKQAEQRFELLDDDFKRLRVSVSGVFFSVESNHGNDQFLTNLFKVKVYGVSEFDLYCMKEMLGGQNGQAEDDSDLESRFESRYGTSHKANLEPIVVDEENDLGYF